MLLPSAFPCEPSQSVSRPLRPKLISHGAYIPTKILETPLQSSCRALQAILGGSANAPQRSSSPVPRSYAQDRLNTARSPLQPRQHNARAAPRPSSNLRTVHIPVQTPRGPNKRRREEYEQENAMTDTEYKVDVDITMQTAENSQLPPKTPEPSRQLLTPKRRRHIPITMPLGLTTEDFAELEAITIPPLTNSAADSESDEDSDTVWTPEDDVLLVQTVLEKLKLSRQQWNDCARVLGRDKDSLGRRWRLLVGEGNVGLRRGVGRMERVGVLDLDIRNW